MVGVLSVFFFFQAEDGIRDGRVTGVQTCALPISLGREYVYRWRICHEHLSTRREEGKHEKIVETGNRSTDRRNGGSNHVLCDCGICRTRRRQKRPLTSR